MTSTESKRRLTTILAADVAGYSALMASDEEATVRTLRAYREIIDKLIARHDGRIFNTAGDAVLAEFSSAVEAVRCAITIQDELRVRNAELVPERQMLFRIGVNLGDVLVEGDDLLGDGVNIAARLEGVAEPGVSVSQVVPSSRSKTSCRSASKILARSKSRISQSLCPPTASLRRRCRSWAKHVHRVKLLVVRRMSTTLANVAGFKASVYC